MKRFINLLFAFYFLFSASAFAVSDGRFYKGADSIVAQSQLPLFYQPSQRFSLIQSLRNARFFGNQGIWNPKIPVHVQALQPKGAPQSYTDSLLQLFFPSPDGVNLTANQASSDPLGQLKLEDVVQLIKLNSQSQLTESDILKSTFPNAKIDEEIHKLYLDFLRYEFLRQVFQKVQEQGDEIYSILEIDPEDSQKYSKVFDKLFPQYKKQGLIEENEIENYASANSISQLILLKKLTNTQKLALEKLKNNFPQFYYFENRRNDFLTYRFVDTFLKAKQEPTYLFENAIEKTLLGYMWLKFKTPEERGKFYKLLGTDDLTDIFKAEGYNFKDYQKLKMQPLDTLDAEQIALIKHGYDLFENPFPANIPYGNATIKVKNKDVTYPDCVEASLLSLLVYKARQFKDGYYQIIADVFPENSPLRGFFKSYTTIEQLFSPDAHNNFSKITAELKNVKYLKPSGNASKTYEVKPGLINSMHVFGELIPDLASLLQLIEKSSFEEISVGLNTFCSYLFPNDATWAWSGIDEDDNLFEKGDIYETIILSRNQEDVLHWEHDLQHTSLECLAFNAKRFSKKESEFLGKSPFTHCFLDLMDIVESGDEVNKLSSIILSTDYRSAKAKIHGMNQIFSLNLENLKPLGFSLVRSLAEADEESTNQFIAVQYSYMAREKLLSDPDAQRILEENPSLLAQAILTDPEKHTYDFVVNTLIDANHQNWIIKVAPRCLSLSINGNQTETLKTLLTHFSSLLELGLHFEDLNGLKAIIDENIFKTQNLELALYVKAFNPTLSWFMDWLQGQKKKVTILPYSFVDPNPESIPTQLAKLFEIHPKTKIETFYLSEEDQEIVQKALPLHSSKEDEDD